LSRRTFARRARMHAYALRLMPMRDTDEIVMSTEDEIA